MQSYIESEIGMKLFNKVTKATKCWINRYINKKRFVNVRLNFPIVSFTFDDFPKSAYRIAGRILKKYNVCATYYTCFGLMETSWGASQQFGMDDLKGLIADGHEVGCHTFNHIDNDECSCREYEKNILKNHEKAAELLNGYKLKNFAYPYGKGSFRLKKTIFKYFKSLRGILPGLNVGWVDLGELRCNRLYSNSVELDSVKKLIQDNEFNRGWLIFYTHDVSDYHSSYGCTPVFFEQAVKLAVESELKVWTVDKAVDYILVNCQKRGGIGV